MKADILIKSSCIFDSTSDKPYRGFVAVSKDRIIGVGTENENEFIGNDTRVYDVGDKTVIPGLNDSHEHFAMAALYKSCADLGEAKSEQDAAKILADFEKKHPSEGWIYGFNWYNFYWDDHSLPTKASLDRYFPDRPVFLFNTECHGAWANSKALEICGIDKNTKDPDGGTIYRDENGEPTGVLDEAAAGLVAKIAMDMPVEKKVAYLKPFLRELATYGVTSIVDVQPLFGVEMSFVDALKQMEADGELTLRAHIAGDLFKDIEIHNKRRATLSTDKVRFDNLKQFVEGIFPTHTCLLLEDYADAPGNKGIVVSDLERIRKSVKVAHKNGYIVKLHAQADRAVRLALDYFEEAIREYGPGRHVIEHNELVDELDMPRYRELDVVPSMQPEHLGLCPFWEDHDYRVTLGDKRAWKCWPAKSLLESAGVLALGTDDPVVCANPYYQINRGMTRLLDNGEPEGGWNPDERLTLAEAIRAYTYGSAYGVGREEELGTLEKGKFADITVVDRNLFDVSPADVRHAMSVLTLVGGEIVYEDSSRL